MKKIVDTYAFGVKESQGGRCQRWWEENPFGNKKRKIQRKSEVQDLDIKKFLNEFNLKGVEFGNWLQQGERYDHLLAAGYALHELSKIVGKNIGFDYNVGIAFGARGMRGAVAHWESVERMINLTKQKGAGSLAHEYAHALDCILGSHSDRHSKYSYLSGGRSVANILKDNVAGDLRAYVNQIVDYIKTTESYKKLFARTSKSPYYHRRTEVFARFFEQYVAYKTNSVNRYLCCSWSLYSYPGNIEYLSEDEFLQILPVADKFARRVKDITSEDGLPAQKTPYPEPIIYKPKGAGEAKPAAQKPTQDTKATKTKTSIITAIRDPKTGRAKMVITGAKKESVKKKVKINLYDYVTKDKETIKLRPCFSGVYYDPKGYAVASDAHILIADKELFNKSLSGKVINKKGEEITNASAGNYPNWFNILPKLKDCTRIKIDIEDLIHFIENYKAKNKEFTSVDLGFKGEYSYEINRLLLFCKAAKRYTGKMYLEEMSGRLYMVADNSEGYIMLSVVNTKGNIKYGNKK